MQYITNLEIANKALMKLGLPEISSFDSKEEAARIMKAVFGSIRDHELCLYPWAFAMDRAALPALADAPAFGFKYKYALPNDFLRLEGIYNHGGQDKDAYEIEGNCILTNIAAPLLIRYVKRNLDQIKWPPFFVEALATRLAIETCERFKQDPQRKGGLWQEYEMNIGKAKRANAIQLSIKNLLPVSWELAHDEE